MGDLRRKCSSAFSVLELACKFEVWRAGLPESETHRTSSAGTVFGVGGGAASAPRVRDRVIARASSSLSLLPPQMAEPVKRSARQRSAKIKIFDEHTRKEIKRKFLDSLEWDNPYQELHRLVDEEDEDYNPLDEGDDSGDGARARINIRRMSSSSIFLRARLSLCIIFISLLF